MLTNAQKRRFVEEGYLQISGVVPQIMIDAARRVVNHSIGTSGMGGENLENNRSAFFCYDILDSPTILAMYNDTPVMQIAEDLMGKGNVEPVQRAKTYPRYPLPLGEDAPEPRGHIDGVGNGLNGTAKGDYSRNFSAFAVVYLMDVPEPYSGNFTVWPKSHRTFATHFKREGHEVLGQGKPHPEMPEPPIMVTGKAGDLIIAHHAMFHTGGTNASPNVRLATIARLRHKDCGEIGKDAYLDIWREWPGVHDVLDESVVA
ncbi:MAG: phytanoyl-CoA dioxygenase family protein [Candidatus Latescibacterota bacterium]